MYEETGGESSFDFGRLVDGLLGVARTKIESDARVREREVWRDPALYGVDEFGRVYLRGQPTATVSSAAGMSSLLVLALVVGGVVLALK